MNQRSNCQHLLDHQKSKRVPKKIYFCFIDYAKALDCVDHHKSNKVPKKIYFCFIVYAKAFDCVDRKKLWKILQEMGIPDHLTCLLRNLCAGQEATVITGHGQQTGSKSGKEYIKAVYCHTAYLTYMQSTT